MEQDREDLLAVDFSAAQVVEDSLPCAGLALDDGVDGFKVAGICRKADPDLAIGEFADALVAEVVFHIAVAGDGVRFIGGGEFIEDRGEGFPDKISQDVQTAAMGHAHFDFLHAMCRAGFEDGVEEDHRTLAAFVGEPFLAEEALAEEIFKRLGLKHPAERVEFFGRSVIAAHRVGFDPFTHPVADGRVVDVHELEADFSRVGCFQRDDHVAQLHLVSVAEKRVRHLAVQIRLGKPDLIETEPGIALGFVFERVDVGLGVAKCPVIVDEARDPAIERRVSIG